MFISSCHWLDAYTPPLDAKISQLVAAVRGVITGKPVAAQAAVAPLPGATKLAEAPAPLAGNKGPILAGGAALLLLLAGAAFYLLRPGSEKPPA